MFLIMIKYSKRIYSKKVGKKVLKDDMANVLKEKIIDL